MAEPNGAAALSPAAGLSPTERAGLVALLYALADDELVIGHRDSEWTGLGPILEEDIAFSSIAQDELGHALALYGLLAELGEGDPDRLAFGRGPTEFRNATLLELPRGDYAFSLVRQLLYDLSEAIRLAALSASSYAPLAAVARKLRPEERYHLVHATSYVGKLARAGGEARDRLQAALDAAFPGALGLFESVEGEAALAAAGIAPPAAELRARWLAELARAVDGSGLRLPVAAGPDGTLAPAVEPADGGRRGQHTPHLTALLDAMQAVYRSDPAATW